MFGVCYYPEHWPETRWREDAEAMAELGLSVVRIGEFAWSRLEPRPGDLQFAWFDRAIDTLASAGLSVVIGTPTATPPKWLIDRWPEVLPVDPDTGRVRGFGSRRHYDFSSDRYLEESLRITAALSRRYGDHPQVIGWQTDNELCCHDTTLSASPNALAGFRAWCKERYGDVAALNKAWGNVFWSMEYSDFDALDVPFGAVTETNPAHQLAYRRYASDRVIDYHRQMVATIRQHASARQFVTHNFIPAIDTNVDDFALAAPLDFPSYDNYPLGRTDLRFADQATDSFQRYMRTGHPDLAAYTHDQTRALGPGTFWIMEQQPGPVNWARHNPIPAPGMLRLWTWEAFAHGADCVAYFRWRQAPFAQEQMHAGLRRPDGQPAPGWAEIERTILEFQSLALDLKPPVSQVAIVTSVEGQWVSDIEQQGAGYRFDDVQFQYYSALRQIGVDVDFVPTDADLSRYAIVIVPSLPILNESFVERLQSFGGTVVFGPRAGAKTAEFQIPKELPPGPLQRLLPAKVVAVETLRPDCKETFRWQERRYQCSAWREQLEVEAEHVLASYDHDGAPAVVGRGAIHYIGCLTDDDFLRDFFVELANAAQLSRHPLAQDVRVRRRGDVHIACNYADTERELAVPDGTTFLLGAATIRPRDVAIWRAG